MEREPKAELFWEPEDDDWGPGSVTGVILLVAAVLYILLS